MRKRKKKTIATSLVMKKSQVRDIKIIATYLIDVLVNDPRSLIKTCELIISIKDQLQLAEEDKQLIETLTLDQIHRNNQLETIWLIYLRLNLFKVKLSQEIIEAVAESPNELAKVMIIEECWSNLTSTMQEAFIASNFSWLLGYQLFLHGYINKDQFKQRAGINHSFSYYNQLKKEGVSFYVNDF